MWNKIKKRVIAVGSAIGVLSLFALPKSAAADDCSVGPIILEVPFNGTTSSTGLPEYIAAMYQFLILAAAITAVVMIMFSGLKWAAAAGNTSMISDAKERIKSAFFGLAIALGSYMILVLINPNLVAFPSICPDSLDFAQTETSNWIKCADRQSSSCNDVQYCNYSDTIDNECTCDNIGSSTGSNYVCRPATDGIVPVGGTCKEKSNCVQVTGVTCVGNSNGSPGVCMATTEGQVCDPNATVAQCSPGETCTEEVYTAFASSSSNGWSCMSDTSREVGAYCTSDSQCSTNICDTDNTDKCLDGATGSSCFDDDDCTTAYECILGQCTGKTEGSGCDTNADCQNTANPDNFCVTDIVGPFGWSGECTNGDQGDTCDGAEDCSASAPFCVDTWGDNECNDGSPGADCRDNSECVSGTCDGASVVLVGTCD